MRDFFKRYPIAWKVIAAGALAGAAYYGIPPEMSGPVLGAVCVALGAC